MGFDVSTSTAYAILYTVLGLFTLLAVGAAGYVRCLPQKCMDCCFLKKQQNDNDNKTDTVEYLFSARNSAGTLSIALSFFASGMGAWVLYGTTEMGANPALSWIAVLGYSAGSALPAILIGVWLGPTIRQRSVRAFSTTDFGRQRYGRIMQVTIAIVSGFYMFIFIVAELTAISAIYAQFTNDVSTSFGIWITVAVGFFTVFYTALAGLPASIVTDKFQGFIIVLLVVMLTVAITTHEDNRITKSEFQAASNWTAEGGMAAATLILAIASAELFNQGTWQRVWAAETVPVMRRGFALGSFMVFLLMMFFGVCGMIAYANDPTSYDSDPPTKFAALAFFDLLEPLKPVWHIFTLILVTALAASSVDSLQNGLSSIFSRDLIKIDLKSQWMTRLLWVMLLVCLNAPAVWLASERYSVLSLFLVADLVCATSVFPVFLGLQSKDYGILKAPTELGAFFGCLSGVAAVLVNGVVVGAEGNLFEYFWLRNSDVCPLCGQNTMITFIVTPAVSLVATYVFSFLDIIIRGDRARQPTIPLAFDKDDRINEDLGESEKRGTVESDEEGDMQPWDCTSVRDEREDEDEEEGNDPDVSIDIISVENGAQEEDFKN